MLKHIKNILDLADIIERTMNQAISDAENGKNICIADLIEVKYIAEKIRTNIKE